MAVSFTRPDPSSPASVADAGFSTVRKGFDQQEVRNFLQQVANELTQARERVDELERELSGARAEKQVSPDDLDEATIMRLVGEETARILQAAHESAAQIRSRAEEGAEALLSSATDEATRVREEAKVAVAEQRSEATRAAEAEVGAAKEQGRQMVNEARAYRERVLAELGRRRDLARQQIERLIGERDRLMGVFAQARNVAADVVGALEPLELPDDEAPPPAGPPSGPTPVVVADDATSTDDDGAAEAQSDAEADQPAAVVDASDAEAPEITEPGAEAATETPTSDAAEPVDTAEAPDDDEPGPAVDAADADDETPDTESPGPEDHGTDVDIDVDQPDVEPRDVEQPDVDQSVGEELDIELSDSEEPDAEAPDDELSDETTEPAPVVALFPNGSDDVEPGDDDVGSEDDQAGKAAQVDDLFARLRAASPDADESTAEAADADESTAEAADAEEVDGLAAVDGSPDDGSEADQAGGDDTTAVIDRASPFARRDAELTPLIVESSRKLKRVLNDEQNEALDTLRQGEPVRRLDQVLADEAAHASRYLDALHDHLEAAAQAGAASAHPDDSDGEVADVSRSGALGPVREALVTQLVGPLRERVARAIDEADGDNDVLTKRIRSIYREWKSQRIDPELDDLLRLAHGRGLLAAVPAGRPVGWIVDPNGPECPDAEDNSLADPVPAGDPFPTGHVCAPAHPGCRCLLSPSNS